MADSSVEKERQESWRCEGRINRHSAASQELLGFHRTLRSRATSESGGRKAKEKTLNALRSPPTGREAIQRLFPRMSCEAAIGRPSRAVPVTPPLVRVRTGRFPTAAQLRFTRPCASPTCRGRAPTSFRWGCAGLTASRWRRAGPGARWLISPRPARPVR